MNELTQESKQRPKPLLSRNRGISKIVDLKKKNTKIVTLKQRNNNQYSTKKMINCLRLFV